MASCTRASNSRSRCPVETIGWWWCRVDSWILVERDSPIGSFLSLGYCNRILWLCHYFWLSCMVCVLDMYISMYMIVKNIMKYILLCTTGVYIYIYTLWLSYMHMNAPPRTTLMWIYNHCFFPVFTGISRVALNNFRLTCSSCAFMNSGRACSWRRTAQGNCQRHRPCSLHYGTPNHSCKSKGEAGEAL